MVLKQEFGFSPIAVSQKLSRSSTASGLFLASIWFLASFIRDAKDQSQGDKAAEQERQMCFCLFGPEEPS